MSHLAYRMGPWIGSDDMYHRGGNCLTTEEFAEKAPDFLQDLGSKGRRGRHEDKLRVRKST